MQGSTRQNDARICIRLIPREKGVQSNIRGLNPRYHIKAFKLRMEANDENLNTMPCMKVSLVHATQKVRHHFNG